MPNLVPGFVWHPVDVGNRAARRKGRGHVAHVAVSGSPLLVPGPLATRPADWHFFLPTVGPGVQMIDLDLQSWSNLNGNSSLTASEAEGGLGTAQEVDAEPWSADQFENLARILAYENETEGTPLQVMPNSLATSRGLAPHRWGISPWRVAGGEVWSSSNGKICPGDTKVAQLPDIVARAVEIVHGSPTPPTPPPPPAPAPGAPARLDYRAAMVDKNGRPLPRNHYIGAIEGPPESHGGDSRFDSDPVRGLVQNVLEWFIYHGCVNGVPSSAWGSSPGWTNTGWNAKFTDPVCRLWHDRFYPGQPYPQQIWADDYDRLARP